MGLTQHHDSRPGIVYVTPLANTPITCMHYYCLYTNLKAKATDIADLRRLIAGQLGKAHNEWHNHDLESGQSIHRYPRVQYKIVRNCFTIVFIEPKEEDFWDFLKRLPLRLKNGERLDFWQLDKLPLRVEVGNYRKYTCGNFLPFDSERYATWKMLCDHLALPPDSPNITDPALIRFLEEILKGQLIKQAAELGLPDLEERIDLKITADQLSHRLVRLYRTRYSKIGNLQFRTNVQWPIHLGIGKGTAIGFGMLR